MGHRPRNLIRTVYFSATNLASSFMRDSLKNLLEQKFHVLSYRGGSDPYVGLRYADVMVCIPVEMEAVTDKTGDKAFSAVLSAGVYHEVRQAIKYDVPVVFAEYLSEKKKWYLCTLHKNPCLQEFRSPDYVKRYGFVRLHAAELVSARPDIIFERLVDKIYTEVDPDGVDEDYTVPSDHVIRDRMDPISAEDTPVPTFSGGIRCYRPSLLDEELEKAGLLKEDSCSDVQDISGYPILISHFFFNS